MQTKYLVLWLEAPLMSYGDGKCLYVRKTLSFPSRGALWGLVFSAAGWQNEQRERLTAIRDLPVTVYGYKTEGSILSDYQIMGGGWDTHDPWQERMVPHKSDGKAVTGTEPTRPLVKQYLQDSVFAAILPFPSSWEGEIRAACASPCDVLSIGRKACVPTIPVLQGVADTFEDALSILSQVEEKRNSVSDAPVQRQRVYEETKDFRKARWRLQDVPLAFRPAYEYGWRYVTVCPVASL